MKIVSIRFLNLNSLKGTHEIRFDESPFLESGLFAITGPTGAGKTTILDAITVALYGKVHRHDRDAFEIMTRHTSESYAEVEFEVKQQVYRSRWSLRRSRGKHDGKLQEVKMELSEVVTGKLIESKLTEVKARIVELTGLDYSQFLRSVMLSQGDFTRFLKASESERSELLEKITDTGIYSQISVWAFEKAKHEKKTLESLRAKLNDVVLLLPEEQEAYQFRLQELNTQEAGLKDAKQKLDTELNWLRTIKKLETQKQEVTNKLAEQEELRATQQPHLERLQRHQSAIVYKPTLAQIETTQSYRQHISKTLESLIQELPALQTEVLEAENKLKEVELLAQAAFQSQQAAQPILEKVFKLDATIQNQKQFYEQALQARQKLQAEAETTTGQTSQKAAELDKLNRQLLDLQTWLQKNTADACLEKDIYFYKEFVKDLEQVYQKIGKNEAEKIGLEKQYQAEEKHLVLLQQNKLEQQKSFTEAEATRQNRQTQLAEKLGGKNIAELETAANDLPKLISLCEQQVQLATHFDQLNIRETEINKAFAQYTQELENSRQELQQYLKQQTEAEAHLINLQQLVEVEIRIQKYEKDREILQAGKACPLCGSEHHPFVQHQLQTRLSEAEEKRTAYQQYVISFTAQVNKQTALVSTLENKISAEKEKLKEIKREADIINHKFAANNELLPKPLLIDKINVIQAVCKRKVEEYDQYRATLNQVRLLENELKTLDQRANQSREAVMRAESEMAQVSERIKNSQSFMQRITGELSDLQEQASHFAGDARSFLRQFGLTFNYEQREALEKELVNRAETYTRNNNLLRDLQLTQNQTATELQKIQEALAEKKGSLAAHTTQLELQLTALQTLEAERQALFGAKNPATEREHLQQETDRQTLLVNHLRAALNQKQEQLNRNQEQQVERQREQNRLQNEFDQLTHKLTAQIQAKGISSVEALVNMFLSEEEAQQIATRQQQLENNLASAVQLLQHTEASLQKETARALTSETEESLQEQIITCENNSSFLNREIGRLEQLLQKDEELKAKHQLIAVQIANQQKEATRWDKLAVLIGSADGKKFSKFAQSLTLSRLVALANQHLRKINQRYRILKNPEQDLDLQIVDTYQADAVRPMTTLSGGESFLVSLALALGLSDLAGRQAQIGSLFIDEGFGTLDSETLDTAITSLENLQATGKMIGIISHVEALKERISTQIQIVKMAGGTSKLKIVGHATDAYI